LAFEVITMTKHAQSTWENAQYAVAAFIIFKAITTNNADGVPQHIRKRRPEIGSDILRDPDAFTVGGGPCFLLIGDLVRTLFMVRLDFIIADVAFVVLPPVADSGTSRAGGCQCSSEGLKIGLQHVEFLRHGVSFLNCCGRENEAISGQ